MPLVLSRCLVVAALLFPLSALAQSDEPKPPAAKPTVSDEPKAPSKKGDEPQAPTKSDEPKAPAGKGDEPSAPGGGDEPAAKGKQEDEPGGATQDEPGGKTQGEPDQPNLAKKVEAERNPPKSAKWGMGVHLRYHNISPWMLGALFDEVAGALNSTAFGLEVLRRSADGDYDIIASVDFGFWGPQDGNYVEAGDDPKTQTDYITFKNFNFLSLAVHFIKHHQILPWMSFIWGGGLGASFKLGNYFRASAGTQCTAENFTDESVCHPLGMDPNNPDAWLNDPANQGTEEEDSPGNPKRFQASFPAVIPLVHLLVGFNFKPTEFLNVRIDGGFRNALYVGGTVHYFF